MKIYHKNKDRPRCTHKVDLMKRLTISLNEILYYTIFQVLCISNFCPLGEGVHNNSKIFNCLQWQPGGLLQKGKRIKARDRLSLYIFVLAMEIFSKILQRGVGECAKFKFHPKYVALKLTYPCFANDLMVFGGAYLQFIQVTLEALKSPQSYWV